VRRGRSRRRPPGAGTPRGRQSPQTPRCRRRPSGRAAPAVRGNAGGPPPVGQSHGVPADMVLLSREPAERGQDGQPGRQAEAPRPGPRQRAHHISCWHQSLPGSPPHLVQHQLHILFRQLKRVCRRCLAHRRSAACRGAERFFPAGGSGGGGGGSHPLWQAQSRRSHLCVLLLAAAAG
jgi:hypothetical protein